MNLGISSDIADITANLEEGPQMITSMESEIQDSNKAFDEEIDLEARELQFEKSEGPAPIVYPKFRQKINSGNSIENRMRSVSTSSKNGLDIKPMTEKPSLNLANLFASPVITSVSRAPINAETYSGKMAILAQKERDAKMRARDLCISKMSNVTTHLENWMVS